MISSIFIFFIFASSYAFNAEVSPSEIKPGDVFLIKVYDIKTSKPPSALLRGRRFYFSKQDDGCFVAIGSMSIKTKPGVYTIKIRAGKKKKYLPLVVNKFTFSTLELILPDEQVFLSKKNLRRVKKENKRLSLIFHKLSKRLWEGNFIMPLEKDISTPFGVKRILNKKWMSIHRGVDIDGEMSEEVKASNNGRVVLTDYMFFGGNTIILDHGLGIYTIYMHLSEFNVKVGEIVAKGDIIGFVGSSGRAKGPHLHFGVKVMNVSTNPVSLMKLNL
jgi:murein DD-endopeptidase MepM/ murein hydrolase activator NlpD